MRHSSDHNPLLVASEKFTSQGPLPFRFQKVWINHSHFHKMVASVWQNFKFFGCPQFVLQQKLKALKPIIKDWNVNVFGNVNTAVALARKSLEKI